MYVNNNTFYARDKRQETRDKRQETGTRDRDKRQERKTRDKKREKNPQAYVAVAIFEFKSTIQYYM